MFYIDAQNIGDVFEFFVFQIIDKTLLSLGGGEIAVVVTGVPEVQWPLIFAMANFLLSLLHPLNLSLVNRIYDENVKSSIQNLHMYTAHHQ